MLALTFRSRLSGLVAVSTVLFAARASCAVPELPRGEVLSAYYIGFEAGPVSLDPTGESKAGAGPGVGIGMAMGVAFANMFPLNFAFGSLMLRDRQPFSEFVVTCSSYGNANLGCSDPEAQTSEIKTSYLAVDTGFQPRLEVAEWLTIAPGALVGYLKETSEFRRGVGCEGCESIPIPDASASGAYAAPTLRMVFPGAQFFALNATSRWFFTGYMQHMTMFGFEILAP